MGVIKQIETVHVIILNYQSYEDTIKYVGMLQQQKDVILNILIVDNCSPNQSFDILSRTFDTVENVEVLNSGRNGGYATGNNFGIKSREHRDDDLIVISNSDLIIDDEYLFAKWSKKHSKLYNVVISAPVMYVDNNPSDYPAWKIPTYNDSLRSSTGTVEKLFGDQKKYIFNNSNEPLVVDCLPGSLFMIKYSEFKALNFFDEGTFLYMEEVILARKIKDSGLRNYLIRDLSYDHLASKTISSILPSRKMRKHLVNGVCYYHKKYDNTGSLKICLLHCCYYIWYFENIIRNIFQKYKNHS